MKYMLVYTFYADEELVGVDVKVVDYYVYPFHLMTTPVDAPSNADVAIVSLSLMDSDSVEWIVPFGMMKIDGENN